MCPPAHKCLSWQGKVHILLPCWIRMQVLLTHKGLAVLECVRGLHTELCAFKYCSMPALRPLTSFPLQQHLLPWHQPPPWLLQHYRLGSALLCCPGAPDPPPVAAEQQLLEDGVGGSLMRVRTQQLGFCSSALLLACAGRHAQGQ
jgi:hypothetical protein